MATTKRVEDSEFFLGNLGNETVNNSILTAIANAEPNFHPTIRSDLHSATIYRDCLTSWLAVKTVNFIETGMRKIVHNVNDALWQLPLDGEWQTDIQLTQYSKVGHHFGWHQDRYDDEDFGGVNRDRKISIVYCLSNLSDYQGGEFQLKKTTPKGIETFRFDMGDFIVFPSDKWHRVKALKGGTRTTLVGWYR